MDQDKKGNKKTKIISSSVNKSVQSSRKKRDQDKNCSINFDQCIVHIPSKFDFFYTDTINETYSHNHQKKLFQKRKPRNSEFFARKNGYNRHKRQ